MNYAVPTNAVMVARGTVLTKKVLSDEARKRKQFFVSYHIVINVDPTTGEPKVEVFERK